MVRHERKPMRKSHASRIVVLSLVLLFVCSGSFAQDMKFPPPPGGGHSGICTDGVNLYVLLGGSILQYSLSTLTLQNTTDLPLPEFPQSE